MNITNCNNKYVNNDWENWNSPDIESISEHMRMTGRTTRLIDKYVQDIYNNFGIWIEIRDHYCTHAADKLIFEKTLRRLIDEHPQDKFEIDKIHLQIRLINKFTKSNENRIEDSSYLIG